MGVQVPPPTRFLRYAESPPPACGRLCVAGETPTLRRATDRPGGPAAWDAAERSTMAGLRRRRRRGIERRGLSPARRSSAVASITRRPGRHLVEADGIGSLASTRSCPVAWTGGRSRRRRRCSRGPCALSGAKSPSQTRRLEERPRAATSRSLSGRLRRVRSGSTDGRWLSRHPPPADGSDAAARRVVAHWAGLAVRGPGLCSSSPRSTCAGASSGDQIHGLVGLRMRRTASAVRRMEEVVRRWRFQTSWPV